MISSHVYVILVACASAILFLVCLPSSMKPQLVSSKFPEIDGLRGILSFSVFLHHSVVWLGFTQSGRWEVSDDSVYGHLGKSSVTLFFMITSFLFVGKLIDAKGRKIDWLHFYVARVLRLGPLYWVAVLLMMLIVACETGFEFHESFKEIGPKVFSWLAFTVPGTPNLNGFSLTNQVVAGVTWSLKYEWFFYSLVPFFALLFGCKPSLSALFISLLGGVGIFLWKPHAWGWIAFLVGGVASFLARNERFRLLASCPASGILVLVLILGVYFYLPIENDFRTMIALGVCFALVASGCSVFGVLLGEGLRVLGEYSYGIYILQGVVLYFFMGLIWGVVPQSSVNFIFFWFSLQFAFCWFAIS